MEKRILFYSEQTHEYIVIPIETEPEIPPLVTLLNEIKSYAFDFEDYRPYEDNAYLPPDTWKQKLRYFRGEKTFETLPSTYRIVNKTSPIPFESPVWTKETWTLWKMFQKDEETDELDTKLQALYLKAYVDNNHKQFFIDHGVDPKLFKYKNIPFNQMEIRAKNTILEDFFQNHQESVVVFSDNATHTYIAVSVIHDKNTSAIQTILQHIRNRINDIETEEFIDENALDYTGDEYTYSDDIILTDEEMEKYTWEYCLIQNKMSDKITSIQRLESYSSPALTTDTYNPVDIKDSIFDYYFKALHTA